MTVFKFYKCGCVISAVRNQPNLRTFCEMCRQTITRAKTNIEEADRKIKRIENKSKKDVFEQRRRYDIKRLQFVRLKKRFEGTEYLIETSYFN